MVRSSIKKVRLPILGLLDNKNHAFAFLTKKGSILGARQILTKKYPQALMNKSGASVIFTTVL
jgi:hypothetical protein